MIAPTRAPAGSSFEPQPRGACWSIRRPSAFKASACSRGMRSAWLCMRARFSMAFDSSSSPASACWLRRRWFHIIRYWHHGIDVGDGTVIHLTGPSKVDAEVTSTSLEGFLKGGTAVIVEYGAFTDRLVMHYDMDPPHERLRTTRHIRVFEVHGMGTPLRYDFASPSERPAWATVLPRVPVFSASKIRTIEERINDPDGAIAEARKHLGEKGYDLQVNNCEHFATFCKTGRRESFQVMELMWGLAPAKSIERGRAVAEATGLEK